LTTRKPGEKKTMALRPQENVQKVLLSTTARFVGEYEKDDILLTHAWPDFYGQPSLSRTLEGPSSRNAFVLAFETKPIEKKSDLCMGYSPFGNNICAYLSVLFGKRFDFHGPVEENGLFHIPDLNQYIHLCNPNLPQNTHTSRIDFPVPLNLREISRIESLFLNPSPDMRKFLRSFNGASKFYLQALQNFERDPEIAYLHLITAGEILSNFFDYEKECLLDNACKRIVEKIRENLPRGKKVANCIMDKLFQVKRRFRETINLLIPPDSDFFQRTESSLSPCGKFRPDSFLDAISAAYDLRSRYVHTGTPFSVWVTPNTMNAEVQFGAPVVEDRDLGKILKKAPTCVGLERVIRFCLLQFAKSQGVYFEPVAVDKSTISDYVI